ncbi:AGAP000204-PA [Anopheles gambiae str. PEST]|uniref:AGAP000204-PA n=1 Tax=Anopheles gambiae TaxID=7165 RepID=A0NCJ3_ANOGA|nr:uncharacterized protein LOC4576158 [Anopheles gambiae]XP_040237448.1 uncharacterized protein LOC120958601 [Anopheles coluzzii]EAU77316.1 AGAP000204-PA [Anopheles gambiae str. PEST]
MVPSGPAGVSKMLPSTRTGRAFAFGRHHFLLSLGLCCILQLCLLAGSANATSMYYKKVSGEKYEPDWVPVSSTVIPLVERVVSVGARTKPSTGADGSQHPGAARLQSADESYKRAYVKHISKFTKIGTAGALVQPGTLITGKQAASAKD